MTFEKEFGVADWQSLSSGFISTYLTVFLPKFSVQWGSNSLKSSLEALGMKQVFNGDRNHFPGLLEQAGAPYSGPISIEDVVHQVQVIVDEKGTEAAAATAIIMQTTSAPPAPEVTFRVDRPALYYIYQKSTGAVLFMGRLANP